jgi:hypothetical protein
MDERETNRPLAVASAIWASASRAARSVAHRRRALLPSARLRISSGIDRNLIPHNGFAGLAVGNRYLLDLRGKLLPTHFVPLCY